MVIFRFFALVLIVAALMVLGYDAISSLKNQGIVSMLSLSELWGLFDTGSRDNFLAWATGQGAGFVETVLLAPAFAVIGVLGVILAFLFRPAAE